MGANCGKVKGHQSTEISSLETVYSDGSGGLLHYFHCNGCETRDYFTKEYTFVCDERKLCPLCYCAAIKVEEEIEHLFNNIKGFFQENKLTFRQSLNIFPVHQAEILQKNRKAGNDLIPNVTYLGLTGSHMGHIRTVTDYWEAECEVDGKVKIFTKTQKLSCGDRKTSILILYGLPWLKFGETLAHEMLHAWFDEQGLTPYLDDEVNEGFCELVAYVWTLRQRIMVYDEHSIKLRELILQSMNSDSGLQGKGFQKAKIAYEKYGRDLEKTMRAVSVYRNFPPS